jgi:hypothetical protein
MAGTAAEIVEGSSRLVSGFVSLYFLPEPVMPITDRPPLGSFIESVGHGPSPELNGNRLTLNYLRLSSKTSNYFMGIFLPP